MKIYQVIETDGIEDEATEFVFENENDANEKIKELPSTVDELDRKFLRWFVKELELIPRKKINPLSFTKSASYASNISITGNYCITASYTPQTYFSSSWQGMQVVPPILTPEPKKNEIVEYFEGLGYKVDYDYSQRLGESWHEICDDKGLIAQIDIGVPLKDILQDLCQFHLGKPGISKSDYKICGSGPRFDEMLKEVYEYELNRCII
jgi:hypothetical protein